MLHALCGQLRLFSAKTDGTKMHLFVFLKDTQTREHEESDPNDSRHVQSSHTGGTCLRQIYIIVCADLNNG